MAKQQQEEKSYKQIVENYLDSKKLDSCDLVRQPFSLEQENFMNIYQKLNQVHYDDIYDKIKKGMCYGYTILWLASMRAIHERKLLDQTDYSPEQVCFFKIIQILQKYENEDINTMPDDTRQYFEASLKYLKTSFNTIKDIQKKQSPDDFFKPNNNNFIFLLPNKDDTNEDEFYTHLYETLSSLSAGTCIQITVPRHAIGCYIEKDKIYLLDPNFEEIVSIDKFRPIRNTKLFSIFNKKAPQIRELNHNQLKSEINTIQFLYYKKEDQHLISFNLLTSEPNEHEMLKNFTNNSIALERETLNKLTELYIEGNGDYFIQLVNSDFLSGENKISLLSTLISKIRDKLIDSDDTKKNYLLMGRLDLILEKMLKNKAFKKLIIEALKDMPPENLFKPYILCQQALDAPPEQLERYGLYHHKEITPLLTKVLQKVSNENIKKLATDDDFIMQTIFIAVFDNTPKEFTKETIIPLNPVEYFDKLSAIISENLDNDYPINQEIVQITNLADLLETANKNLPKHKSIDSMRKLEELRSKIIQKYPDDNNTLQPVIDHLNNAIQDCEQKLEANKDHQLPKPGP